jgi:hypothetical protein
MVKPDGLASWLGTFDDAALAHLLSQRRDVLVSPPRSVEQLGLRLSGDHSVELGLSVVDRSAVQVALALSGLGGQAKPAEIEQALGGRAPDGHVLGALERLGAVGLAWPHPSGAWCTVPAMAALARGTGAGSFRFVAAGAPLELIRQALGLMGLSEKGTRQQALLRLCAEVESPPRLAVVLSAAPPEVVALIAAFTQDGPLPYSLDEVSRWLAKRCLLIRTGSSQMTSPLEVLGWYTGANAQLVLEPELLPPSGPPCSADAALLLVARMRALLGTVGTGLKVLQSGGIGVQEHKRLGKVLGLDATTVAWLLVLAGDVALLTAGSDEGRLTRQGAAWLELEDVEAYIALMRGVLDANLARVGDQGPPLAGYRWPPEQLPTVRDLLRGSLQPATDADLVGWLEWRWSDVSGRLVAPEIAGFEALGLRERGHPAPWLAPLLDGEDAGPAVRSVLPPEQDDAVFQADGTVIVAGRPSAELSRLLGAVADREGGHTWRMSSAGVGRALNDGRTAPQLLEELTSRSRNALPQVIEQLVRDAGDKHGQIQVFAAETLLRIDDEPLRIMLLRDKRLVALGLKEVQPGLLASSKKPAEVMSALRGAGHAPVGPAEKGRKLPIGNPVEPAGWRMHYADPVQVVAALRSTPGPSSSQGIDVEAWQPNQAWARAYTPQLPPDQAHLLHLATLRDEACVEIDYRDSNGRRTTRVVSELVQSGKQLEAWCDLRDDERVFLLHNVLAVRPA